MFYVHVLGLRTGSIIRDLDDSSLDIHLLDSNCLQQQQLPLLGRCRPCILHFMLFDHILDQLLLRHAVTVGHFKYGFHYKQRLGLLRRRISSLKLFSTFALVEVTKRSSTYTPTRIRFVYSLDIHIY
jgi:hypothetical protein